MFKDTPAFSGFAVDDTAKARTFYEDVLGVEVTEEHGILTLLLAGGTRPTIAYPKPGHVPAEFTILNFPTSEIAATVDALAARGVEFQRYPGMEEHQDERGIFTGGGPLIAWFTDPAGNVLSVIQQD